MEFLEGTLKQHPREIHDEIPLEIPQGLFGRITQGNLEGTLDEFMKESLKNFPEELLKKFQD